MHLHMYICRVHIVQYVVHIICFCMYIRKYVLVMYAKIVASCLDQIQMSTRQFVVTHFSINVHHL